jgi:hypothetical protein
VSPVIRISDVVTAFFGCPVTTGPLSDGS